MTGLVEFVEARISEDEAKVAWMRAEMARVQEAPGLSDLRAGMAVMTGIDLFVNADRWAAECAAKRRILEIHSGYHSCGASDYGIRDAAEGDPYRDWGNCPTLLALAAIWSGHESFDPAWVGVQT